jgi:hypothetical protein
MQRDGRWYTHVSMRVAVKAVWVGVEIVRGWLWSSFLVVIHRVVVTIIVA